MCFFVLDGRSLLINRSLKTVDAISPPRQTTESPLIQSLDDYKFNIKIHPRGSGKFHPDEFETLEKDQNFYSLDKSTFFKRDKRVYTKASSVLSRKLPEVLIIGVKKGGTRALLEFLRIHPNIRASGRETHYFDKNYDKGVEWYR